ncbi:MAG: hypothetical protein NW204_12375 [Xanthomonadaceae bacterium]|nr:hypothetical protein [Xanthomonadaceae bacterium]
MLKIALFAGGASALLLSKIVFRTIQDAWNDVIAGWKIALMNLAAVALFGLGVFMIAYPAATSDWLNAFLPSTRPMLATAPPGNAQSLSNPEADQTDPPANVNRTHETDSSPAPIVTESSASPPNTSLLPVEKPSMAAELTTLILAAIGIVMTLVTTIVIAVSRAAIDDIRRIEKKFAPRIKKHVKLDQKWEARFQLHELRQSLAIRSANLAEANRNAIKTLISNIKQFPQEVGLPQRLKARERIRNLYSTASYDVKFMELFVETFNGLKDDLCDEIENEEIHYLDDLARLGTDLAAGNGNGQPVPEAGRTRLHRLAGELRDLAGYFRSHRRAT